MLGTTQIKSNYLIADPLPWLLKPSDPSIRYLTLRDIVHDRSINYEYETLVHSPGIIRLLAKQKNSILGDTDNFDLYYRGTMWYFADLVDSGLDRRTPEIERTAKFLLDRCQKDSGGFSLRWKPELPVACRTGEMLRYLQRAGYRDKRIDRGIQWILSHQRHDGGWLHCPLQGYCDFFMLTFFNRAGKGIERDDDISVTSCIYASSACLMALLEYPHRNPSIENAIYSGSEFFLRRRLFKTSGNRPISPRYGWNDDFRLLGYPLLTQYDILNGLIIIARTGRIADSRTGEAFNLIVTKQNRDGTWNLESAKTGMRYGNMKKAPLGTRNKWVTLNALRLLTLID